MWPVPAATEEARYIYPLRRDSIVFDVGAFHGNWSRGISDKYYPRIFAFEPVAEFYRRCTEGPHALRHPNVQFFDYGLGARTERCVMHVNNDSSSCVKPTAGARPEEVLLRSIDEVLAELGIGKVIDLIKINIEGGEYELLEHMISTGLIDRCRDVQVQFHAIASDSEERRENIRDALLRTHELTYDTSFVWENWRRRAGSGSSVNDYFDAIYCINLDDRTDKWAECEEQARRYGLTKMQRISAVDGRHGENGMNAIDGCTASHRVVLEKIIEQRHARTLVLEDDFLIRHYDFNDRFTAIVPEVPVDWAMLYLGGHYAEKPLARVSPNVIRNAAMLTTSSYGITLAAAREMLPVMAQGGAAPDSLYFDFNRRGACYTLQPRLMAQRVSFSDLQQRECNNLDCMEDPTHEAAV